LNETYKQNYIKCQSNKKKHCKSVLKKKSNDDRVRHDVNYAAIKGLNKQLFMYNMYHHLIIVNCGKSMVCICLIALFLEYNFFFYTFVQSITVKDDITKNERDVTLPILNPIRVYT